MSSADYSNLLVLCLSAGAVAVAAAHTMLCM
jgi:hypothetical protein